MMDIKVIKSEEEYQSALAYLDSLMGAAAGSDEARELELLSILIEKYEEEHYPIPAPDPLEAIRFRMEQQGLTRKDLIPYIGSQSKVSEVLSGKRPLSLTMIRNLNAGLGIPADVLIRQSGGAIREKHFNINDYPFKEMYHNKYFDQFNGTLAQAKQQGDELLKNFFAVMQNQANSPVYCRTSEGEVAQNALIAWKVRVLNLVNEKEFPGFDRKAFTQKSIKELVGLSSYSTGPLNAQEYLQKRGIPLIILPHLRHTFLDGACFMSPDGRPVIGMTLRHDRLDNFWFTLAHELAHIILHLLQGQNFAFFDDLDHEVSDASPDMEKEANDLSAEFLIPNAVWAQEKESLLSVTQEKVVVDFAAKLGISPAIPAGRIRWEKKDFSHFSSLIGNGSVRKLFQSQGCPA